MWTGWQRCIAAVCLGLGGIASGLCATPMQGSQTWINAWSAPHSDAFASIVLDKQTLRQMLTVLHGGETLRIRLSNHYGRTPVTLDAVHIGVAAGDAGVRPGTGRALHFGGQARVTLAPGASVWSDPVALSVSAMQRLTMSLYAEGRFTGLSKHTDGIELLWRASGNRAADESGAAFSRVQAAYWVLADAIDVLGPAHTRVVAVFGDSVAERFMAAMTVPPPAEAPPLALAGAKDAVPGRPSGLLAARLGAPGQAVSLVNAAVMGNRLLGGGAIPIFGPPGLSRVARDAIDVSGVTDVIVLIGINDLGLALIPQPQALIQGLHKTIEQLRAAGLRVHVGTLSPGKGMWEQDRWRDIDEFKIAWLHGRESVSRARETVNQWIRTASPADRVIDFDACLRDPAEPSYLLPAYDSGDHLHPGALGLEIMARCVDLGADPR